MASCTARRDRSTVGAWDVIRQKLGKPLHSRDLVEEAAELGVKDPLRQSLDAVRQRNAPVLVPEEARIGEPRPQYSLIACDDRLATDPSGDVVGDEQKSWGGRAVGLQTGEIFLMRAHRGRQDFRRKRHVLGVDRAGEYDRKLDQAGYLVEQPGIWSLSTNPSSAASRFETLRDHFFAAAP